MHTAPGRSQVSAFTPYTNTSLCSEQSPANSPSVHDPLVRAEETRIGDMGYMRMTAASHHCSVRTKYVMGFLLT